MAKIKVTIDRDTCIGCGLAPAVCSQVFEMIDGKNAIREEYRIEGDLSKGEVPGELLDCVKEAVEGCPVEAIKIEE